MSALAEPDRPVIYQLLVRTFSNTEPGGVLNGTLAENGCGKFSEITDLALAEIRSMGFNHIWLTGILEQASDTSYPGRPADVPDILKGRAGSPYAIKDYFDVCPDYAEVPEQRLTEFRDLLTRCKNADLRILIDFVPNHVARSYGSSVCPELSFGEGDRTDLFFHRDNHFYYLDEDAEGGGPPLKLPTSNLPGCTGFYLGEAACGRVTGNNAATWAPSIHDWYETVKINYGHDYRQGRRTEHLPELDSELSQVPKTWRTMDQILAYWQEMGVDGFRVDMAHIVPMEFWRWAVKRARARDADVFFGAEAYDSDPDKLTDANVLEELHSAGFDGAYEHPTYKILQGIYENGYWANDLDEGIFCERFHHCIRYIENHDEVRIANPQHWGGVGAKAGRPAAAVMYGMSRAAIMLYSGQEIGERAVGAEGFSGDDGRTSIFDYTSMPDFQGWVNGGKFDGGGLDEEAKALRSWYAKLFQLLKQPAFTKGNFYGLNQANIHNEKYGRVDGEEVSGHFFYSFLRHDQDSKQSYLVVVNFSPDKALQNVSVNIPAEAVEFCGLQDRESVRAVGRFKDLKAATLGGKAECYRALEIELMPPLSAEFYELL